MSSDANLANFLGLARTALLAGNNQEALTYFNRVLEIDPTISEAWMGKGKAAGWQSTLVNIRTNEAMIAFSHAIANAPDHQKQNATAEAVNEANRIVVALYQLARQHLQEFVALDGSWVSYLNQVSQLLDALEQTRSWNPADRTTLENIVHLCKDNIEGISYRNFDGTPNAWHLSPEYEGQMKARLDSAVADLRRLDPGYTPPAVQKKQSEACFVVTATMGDPHHPTVRLMRDFRDGWLVQSRAGRQFIRSYYRYGPKAAEILCKNSARRLICYNLIVRPAAAAARLLMRRAPHEN